MNRGKKWFLNGIRILTLSVCVLAVFVSITRGQVRPPGGIGGAPPPPIAQPPITQPPIMQPPIGQPPIGQPPIMQPPKMGIGGNIGGGPAREWFCTRCNASLGTGPLPVGTCPGCNARVINGAAGGGIGGGPPPGMNGGGIGGAPPMMPPIKNPVVPPINNMPVAAPGGPAIERGADEAVAVNGTNRSAGMTVGMIILICVLVGVVILAVCVAGGVLLVMMMKSAGKKAPKPRRSRF